MTNYDTLKEYEEHKEPLPSYEEYQDIIQQNVNQDAAIETYIEDIKRLQEQLKGANEVIKIYAETKVGHKQKDGTYRLSVATGTINFLDPFFGIKSEMQEYVYDPRPAKKYLKKWGIK